jgi:hypothetical protein
MNSGQTQVADNGQRRSAAGTVIRGARQTLGGAVTVVGSVGTVAGRLLDGTGTVLDTTAGALSGTILLLGDVLNTTGHVLGSTLSGLGGTLTLAGGLMSGGTFADARAAGAASPAKPRVVTEPVLAEPVVTAGASKRAPATGGPRPAPVRRSRPGGPARPPANPS